MSLLCLSFRAKLTIAVLAIGAGLFTASAAAQEQSERGYAAPGTAMDRVPGVFTVNAGSALLGYSVDGEPLDSETFEDVFDLDAAILDDVVIDYVTQSGRSGVSGASVVAANVESGGVYVSAGALVDASSIGFTMFSANFGEGDELLSGNLDPSNDANLGHGTGAGRTQLHPDTARNEILIRRADRGTLDVFQYDQAVSGFPIVHVDTLELGLEADQAVVVADIGDFRDDPGPAGRISTFRRRGLSGTAEIIVADPDSGQTRVFDSAGTELDTLRFDLGFGPGDRLATGNVNGVGGENLLVAHPDTGEIDVFSTSITGAVTSLTVHKEETLNVGLGPDDDVAVADIIGNGLGEILVARADTGHVDVYRYDLLEQTLVSEEPAIWAHFDPGDHFAVLPVRYGDASGDGLFDHWKTHGVDIDGDGTVEVDLPAMDADPDQKELFIEYDYVDGHAPTRGAIDLLQDAFANAPVNAGGMPTPTRQRGIALRIDTGGLREGGLPVGEDLGGGERIPREAVPDEGVCGLDDEYEALKEEFFDPVRAHVFRYGLHIDSPLGCDPVGRGEIGGNDFVVHPDHIPTGLDYEEAALIMHELGHTLSLLHGGFEDRNCKPNYVSVMNYAYDVGIQQRDGGRLVDFSSPRVGAGRGQAPLPSLVESALEPIELDPTDDRNKLVYADVNGDPVWESLDAEIDWGGESELSIDNLAGCRNQELRELRGHDDWNDIILRVRNSAHSAAGAVVAPEHAPISVDEIRELREALHTSDLGVELSAKPDQAVAGAELAYEVMVTNHGPNPADEPEITFTLPPGVRHAGDDSDCERDDAELRCPLDQLLTDESTKVTIRTLVAPDLVFEAGGPTTVEAAAEVAHGLDFATDPNPDNTSTELTTDVVGESDLAMAALEPPAGPVDALLEQPSQQQLAYTIANHGPSGPTDAAFDLHVDSPAGVDVDVADAPEAVALEVGEKRTVPITLEVLCTEPGIHELSITAKAFPATPGVDPATANNEASVDFAVHCIIPVVINIRPGDEPNPVNPDSEGVIPVAVLSTDDGEYGHRRAFDATQIDPSSVVFARPENVLGTNEPTGAPAFQDRGHTEDAYELDQETKDGDLDMLLRFRTQQTSIQEDDTEACLRGESGTGQERFTFFGCGDILVRS